MIYQKGQVQVPIFLSMIFRFSWWFGTLLLNNYFLNEDLSKTLQSTCKWKMLFNPDNPKQKISHANSPSTHSNIYVSNMPLKRENAQKDLGLVLDAKLIFFK